MLDLAMAPLRARPTAALVHGRPVVAPAMTLQLPQLSFWPPSPASPKDGQGKNQPIDLTIRGVEQRDRDQLADICTDSFFGTHTFADGPVIFVQRLLILMRVRMQLTRRIGFETDDRECRLFVAEDENSGRICGLLDLAVHLYDRDQQRFWLTIDEMPKSNPMERNRWSWQPYLASVAVRSIDRRRGVARQLVVEAERVAKQWGYKELWLEVAQSNEPALTFYRRRNYRTVKAWERGKAGAGAQVVTRTGFWWEVSQEDKFVMRKPLGFTWGQSDLA